MQKILFVEDESALQRAVSNVLVDQGYKIFSAMDGETAIALAVKELPDVMVAFAFALQAFASLTVQV